LSNQLLLRQLVI